MWDTNDYIKYHSYQTVYKIVLDSAFLVWQWRWRWTMIWRVGYKSYAMTLRWCTEVLEGCYDLGFRWEDGGLMTEERHPLEDEQLLLTRARDLLNEERRESRVARRRCQSSLRDLIARWKASFRQTEPLFDMVDVGLGKEGGDPENRIILQHQRLNLI